MTILVSIISDQSLPNYLLIKEFQEQVDVFLFITSKQMEQKNKSALLYKTAGIDKKKTRVIPVDENELYLIHTKLDHLGWKNDTKKKYLVNITGGTKLMSNAVFNYFSKLNSRFFYVPFGQNVYQALIPQKSVRKSPFTYEISIAEYLAIYGIDYTSPDNKFPENICESVFTSFKKSQYNEANFPYSAFHTGQKKNIIGQWFEHLMYYRLKNSLKLTDTQIALNLELFDQTENKHIYQNDNEIDIAFIKNNRIYIVEAKSSIGAETLNVTNLYNQFYKLAAVNRRFGLASRAFVITLTDIYNENPKRLENIQQRCNILNLNLPLDQQDIETAQIFKRKLNQITK
jgi:hypothetical protein